MSVLVIVLMLALSTLLLLVVGVALWFWAHIRPIRFRSLDDLHHHFVRLLGARRPNAELRIRVRGGPTTLRFLLRERKGDTQRIITLEYPRLEWSEPFYSQVQRAAAAAGLAVHEHRAGVGRVNDTLEVSFGRDTRRAAQFAWEVIRDVYEVPSPETESNVFPIIPGTYK